VVSENFPAGAGVVSAGFAAGSRIAGYQLEEQIGAGGMAVVFRARDERLQRQVALKILGPALAPDEAFRQRFIRESRAAAAVDDPHIIPVFDAGEAAGALFIAMRYLPGGDAGTLVRRAGPLSPGRALAIISPVASALDAAHGSGLVHRDVKPANMLVDVRPGRPDHVYLSDFGLSKWVMTSLGPTRSGQFLGTPGYSAPEQLEGKPVDGRADQYSLGCAAFELLCGEAPFPRDQVTAMIWAHMSEPPPMATARRPGLPPAVDGVLAKALAKAPGDRYATCREFADALREAFDLAPYDSDSEVPRKTAALYSAPDVVLSHAATQTNGGHVWRPGTGEMPAEAGKPERGTSNRPGMIRPRSRISARPVALSLAALVVALGAVVGLLVTRSPQNPPRVTKPQLAASYSFPAQRYKNGLLIARRWTLSGKHGSQLTETITVSNATGKPIATWFQDSIPAGITSTVQAIRFRPDTVKIVHADPVVEWYLRLPARGTVTVGYTTAVPPKGATDTRLAGWAKGLDTLEERLNTAAARHPRPARPTVSPVTSSPPAEAPAPTTPTPTPASSFSPDPWPVYSCDPSVVTCGDASPSPP
jgi:serine/threonine-protein kinase